MRPSRRLPEFSAPMNSDLRQSGEFAFISALAKRAAHAPEALGLSDDGAVLWLADGRKLVITTDMLQAGVHTMQDAHPAQIARKALRTNLSDLAAMGAEPAFYLSTIAWPKAPDEQQTRALADALAEEQEQFNLSLIGGDTICGQGPFTISITMLGWAQGPLLRRNGAQVGDDVWVSGTIGDAWLGLRVVQGKISSLAKGDLLALRKHYEYPEPRLSLGTALAYLAHGALDVSDGLIADAMHLARAGSCAIRIDPALVPLSTATQRWLKKVKDQNLAVERLMAGGDDYELLFTASAENREPIYTLSDTSGVRLSRIGSVIKGNGVMLGNADSPLHFAKHRGFTHF